MIRLVQKKSTEKVQFICEHKTITYKMSNFFVITIKHQQLFIIIILEWKNYIQVMNFFYRVTYFINQNTEINFLQDSALKIK